MLEFCYGIAIPPTITPTPLTHTRVRVIVFNATFNHISVISWTGGSRSTRRKLPVASHCYRLSHNVVSSTPSHKSDISRHISLFIYTEVIAQNICVNMQQECNDYIIMSFQAHAPQILLNYIHISYPWQLLQKYYNSSSKVHSYLLSEILLITIFINNKNCYFCTTFWREYQIFLSIGRWHWTYEWKVFNILSGSKSWSYGSWVYSYLCNQCILPLRLWVRAMPMARYTRYNIEQYMLKFVIVRLTSIKLQEKNS